MHAHCTVSPPEYLVPLLPPGTLESHTHRDNGTDRAEETPDEPLVQVEPAAGNNGKRDTTQDQRMPKKNPEMTPFPDRTFLVSPENVSG